MYATALLCMEITWLTYTYMYVYIVCMFVSVYLCMNVSGYHSLHFLPEHLNSLFCGGGVLITSFPLFFHLIYLFQYEDVPK